jgi:hypothetical protein
MDCTVDRNGGKSFKVLKKSMAKPLRGAQARH